MEKNYEKMNTSHHYLSLGNLFNILKNNAINKKNVMQMEVFCSLFNTNDVNNTTVNNYFIGYRAIGIEYKKRYFELEKAYEKDKTVFLSTVYALLNILEDHIYFCTNSFDAINQSSVIKKVCYDLLNLAQEDSNISSDFINEIQTLMQNTNYYEAFVKFLLYAILENKQPIFIQEIKVNLESKDLEDYLKINLYEGLSYISSLEKLAKKNNMYACAELGSLEFSGLISGKVDFQKSYDYYLRSAKKGHPKGCWMVANLILTKRVEVKNSFDVLWKYLTKAVKLGSIAALNTMGNCYLNGQNPEKIINEQKALYYYEKASEYGYTFAYNNLGMYYEKKGDYAKAFKYFHLSASLNESWALNKIGEIYRKENNLKEAYFYYEKALSAPLNERNYYSYYNIAKYYLIPGFKEINIKKDLLKAKKYLNIAYENGILEAKNLLEDLNNY